MVSLSRKDSHNNRDDGGLTGSQTYLLLTIEHSEIEPEPVKKGDSRIAVNR